MSNEEYRECSMPDCNEPARLSQRYCKVCHAKYMRGWRAKKKKEISGLVDENFRLRRENRDLRDKLKTPAT